MNDPDKDFASFRWAIDNMHNDNPVNPPDDMALVILKNAQDNPVFAQNILTKLLDKVTMNAKDAKAALEEQKISDVAVEQAISNLEKTIKGNN